MDPYLEKVLEYLNSAFHACQWSSIIKYLTVTCNYTENPCLNCEPEVYYHLGFAYSKVFAYDTNVFKSIGSDVKGRAKRNEEKIKYLRRVQMYIHETETCYKKAYELSGHSLKYADALAYVYHNHAVVVHNYKNVINNAISPQLLQDNDIVMDYRPSAMESNKYNDFIIASEQQAFAYKVKSHHRKVYIACYDSNKESAKHALKEFRQYYAGITSISGFVDPNGKLLAKYKDASYHVGKHLLDCCKHYYWYYITERDKYYYPEETMFVTASDAVVLNQCREFCYIYKCFSDCLLNNTDSILDDNYMVPMSADFYDSNFLNLDTALDKDTKQRSLAEDFYNISETLLLMHIHVDACKALGKDISQLYGNACLFELSDKLLYHALSITDMANKSAASRCVRHQDGYIKERIARHKIIQQDYDGARHLIANRQKGYEITTLLYCHMALNDKKSFKRDLAIAKGNNPNFETHAMRCISNHMRRVFNQYCSLDTKPDARYD